MLYPATRPSSLGLPSSPRRCPAGLWKPLFVLGLTALLAGGAAWAEDRPLASDPLPGPTLLGDPPVDEGCSDGVVHDDGTTEIGWGWVPSVLDGRYVQEFRSADFPLRTVDTVCVCFRRSSTFPTDDDTIDFRVEFYRSVPAPDPDGLETFERVPALRPFASVAATATGIPIGEGKFTTVDVGSVTVPPGTSYIGVAWDASIEQFFFTCADTSEETEPVSGFFIEEQSDAWTSFFKATDPNFLVHRALLIRANPGSELAVEVPTLGAAGVVLLGLALTILGWRRLR